MNVHEALVKLKAGGYVKCPKEYVGLFRWYAGKITFTCPDNCCEWDYTEEEFLEREKNSEFEEL